MIHYDRTSSQMIALPFKEEYCDSRVEIATVEGSVDMDDFPSELYQVCDPEIVLPR